MSKRAFLITIVVVIVLAAAVVALHRHGGPIVNTLHGLHGR